MRGDVDWRAIRANQPHYVYRVYAEEGYLLYVGMTYNPPARMKQHAKGAPWFRLASTYRLTVFPSRDYAAQKEREAIVLEDPIYNRAHKRGHLILGYKDPDYIYDERDLPPHLYAQLQKALSTILARPPLDEVGEEPDVETVHDRKRAAFQAIQGGAA